MKQFTIAFFVLILSVSFGQGTYTTVDDIELTGAEPIPPEFNRKKYSWFWSSADYAINTFANIAYYNINAQLAMQQKEMNKQNAANQLNIIQRTYAEYETLPEKIADGWHKAMASDNLNFCKEVKVLVQNNKINKMVIDNCIPLDATAFSSIKKCKGTVAINTGGNGQTVMADVYFIFDLEEPMIVSEPVRPGYISFWTNVENFETAEIYINGERMPSFTTRFQEEPDCFTSGMSTKILAPGTYYFKVERRGADWDGSVEIKPGMCLKYPLIEEERTGPPRPGQRN